MVSDWAQQHSLLSGRFETDLTIDFDAGMLKTGQLVPFNLRLTSDTVESCFVLPPSCDHYEFWKANSFVSPFFECIFN